MQLVSGSLSFGDGSGQRLLHRHAFYKQFPCNFSFQRELGFADPDHVRRSFLLENEPASGHESVNSKSVTPGSFFAGQPDQFRSFAFGEFGKAEDVAPGLGGGRLPVEKSMPPRDEGRARRELVTATRAANQIAEFVQRAALMTRGVALAELECAKRAMEVGGRFPGGVVVRLDAHRPRYFPK